jgi:diaminopimelate epimerase
MKIPFSKYHGTGNDFIIIDNRKLMWKPGKEEIARLCNRHFGIGADGLMLLSEKPGFDFYMTYYNSDGGESTMCGNGGRCMIIFAQSLGLTSSEPRFMAVDGEHTGKITIDGKTRLIKLKMKNVTVNEIAEDHLYIDTGSPHYVIFTNGVESMDIIAEAKKIRYNTRFAKEGTNVDFVEIRKDHLFVRSYERGVEDETLSCGTGVTASALAYALKYPSKNTSAEILTKGGILKVYYMQSGNAFSDIWLEGPVEFVFAGEIKLSEK